MAFAFFHAIGAAFAWLWANLTGIATFIGSLSIVMAATNAYVKRQATAHPCSRFWHYLDVAFGPDPENSLGKVVTVLDKLAANRHRHDV